MNDTISAIIEREWSAFQQVLNVGGRASCQDDFTTFRLMRESQFAAWSEPLRQSYLGDLADAERAGRNLLEEKYARMMQATAPEEYSRIEPLLPPVKAEDKSLAEAVHAVLVGWQEEFAAAYPSLASAGRPVRDGSPSGGSASFAVYLMGELLTYSSATLALLADYVRELQTQGKNLSVLTMEHMVARYGYPSLDLAEAKHRP